MTVGSAPSFSTPASKNTGVSRADETAVCPACGTAGASRELSVPDHEYALEYVARYLHCDDCGSAFQAPMPESDRLSSFYPPEYHSMGRRGLLPRIKNQMRLRRLKPLLEGDGAMLDYGCGDGSFLEYAAEALPERHFVGFEIDAQPSQQTLVDGRVTLVRGSHRDLMQALPPCRLITMNHVIEHLPDPLATLADLRSRLLPGGCIEGQTPAAGSLEHRVFGASWSGYHAPRHTVIFSKRGLSRLFERAGFEQAAVSGAFNPAGIAVSLATLPQKSSVPGKIERSGPAWLFWLGLASALAPIDLLSGSPGIIDFRARLPL